MPSFNIQYLNIGLKKLRFDEHGRIGLIFNLSINIQYHTIGLKWLKVYEDSRIGLIFNLSINIQDHIISLKNDFRRLSREEFNCTCITVLVK